MELILNDVLIILLASTVPIPSQGVIVETELAYFSYWPGRKALVYFQKGSDRKRGDCCRETIEIPASDCVRARENIFH